MSISITWQETHDLHGTLVREPGCDLAYALKMLRTGFCEREQDDHDKPCVNIYSPFREVLVGRIVDPDCDTDVDDLHPIGWTVKDEVEA
jgi:hypothetical protein